MNPANPGEAAPPPPFQPPNECPRCEVRGWIDSSPAWGTVCRCRVCKHWFDGVTLLPADLSKPAVRYYGKPLTADQRRVLKFVADAGPAGVPMGSLLGSDWRRVHALERAGLVDDLGEHRRRRITLTGRSALGAEAGPYDHRGHPVPRECPRCAGTLQPEGDGFWRCDGLADSTRPDLELAACAFVHEAGTPYPPTAPPP